MTQMAAAIMKSLKLGSQKLSAYPSKTFIGHLFE